VGTVVAVQKNPGCLIQILWFAFVGWWAGQIWIAVAWALMLTVIGIPFSVIMLNMIPQVIALRGQSGLEIKNVGGRAVVANVPQYNILIRAIYFVLIGWWLSGLWMQAAYFLCLTIIGLPFGFWMFDWVPAIVSLRR
jgi:uncharacterized membrane protein YccF (DUF307 family)